MHPCTEAHLWWKTPEGILLSRWQLISQTMRSLKRTQAQQKLVSPSSRTWPAAWQPGLASGARRRGRNSVCQQAPRAVMPPQSSPLLRTRASPSSVPARRTPSSSNNRRPASVGRRCCCQERRCRRLLICSRYRLSALPIRTNATRTRFTSGCPALETRAIRTLHCSRCWGCGPSCTRWYPSPLAPKATSAARYAPSPSLWCSDRRLSVNPSPTTSTTCVTCSPTSTRRSAARTCRTPASFSSVFWIPWRTRSTPAGRPPTPFVTTSSTRPPRATRARSVTSRCWSVRRASAGSWTCRAARAARCPRCRTPFGSACGQTGTSCQHCHDDECCVTTKINQSAAHDADPAAEPLRLPGRRDQEDPIQCWHPEAPLSLNEYVSDDVAQSAVTRVEMH